MVHQHSHVTQQGPGNSGPTTLILQKTTIGSAGPVLYTQFLDTFNWEKIKIFPHIFMAF